MILIERLAAANSFLAGLEMFGVKLGLENTRALFEAGGDPHRRLRFIHIAGTNGKGSVAAMAAAALRAAGFRVGLYTSPHLVSIRERFRIDGAAVSEEELAAAAEIAAAAVDAVRSAGGSPTFFEATTLMAAWIFERRRVDYVVWETGMGGRLDATNIVSPLCSVITNVGIDHQKYLGTTLAAIAAEKAGIIKPGKPVFLGIMDDLPRRIMESAAAEREAPVYRVADANFEELPPATATGRPRLRLDGVKAEIPFGGAVSAANAKLALLVMRHLSMVDGFDLARAATGLGAARWPGRFQTLEDGTIVDGAHNPDGARALVEFASSAIPAGSPPRLVFACLADKPTDECLRILAPLAEEFIFPLLAAPPRPQTPPTVLGEALATAAPGKPFRVAASVAEALEMAMADGRRAIVAGSLFLVAETLANRLPEEQILNLGA